MEGYLIHIPRDAWLGGNASDVGGSIPRRGPSKKCVAQAQLLYYVLGEGFLRGYASPDDTEPIDSFQLTSFHVQVDPMYSMLLFEVFAKNKDTVISSAAAAVAAGKAKAKASKEDSSDESSESENDNEAQDASVKQQKSSILLFAANKTLVQTWGSRVLNWNRYVFASDSFADDDSDELDREALEASRLELLQAFQQHQCASWFARPLALKSSDLPAEPVPRRSKTGASFTNFSSNGGPVAAAPTKTVEATESGDPNPASRPWWMLNASQTRRISSNSLRK